MVQKMTDHLVLDTNIILSGLIWGGKPAGILDHIESGHCRLYTSYTLIEEFNNVLSRPKFTKALKSRNLRPTDLVRWLVKNAVIVTPKPLRETVIPSDPSDEAVLACAATVQADCIISGDAHHLLPLKTFRGIPILTATQYQETHHE